MSENANGAQAVAEPIAADPETEIVTRARTITESDLVGFSSLTGDWHPQHADAEWAAGSRFGGRVAHGMLLLSYAVGLFPFDPERVVALRGLDSISFKRPVSIGDTIRVASRVERRQPLDAEHELVTLGWRILNQEDKVVVRARVSALWRRGAPGTGAEAPEVETDADRARPLAAAAAGESEMTELYGERLAL